MPPEVRAISMKHRTAGDGSFRRLTRTRSERTGKSASGRYAMLGMLTVSREAGTRASPITPSALTVDAETRPLLSPGDEYCLRKFAVQHASDELVRADPTLIEPAG
jgi:hypothetical protein